MLCGFCELDITPHLGVNLPGQFHGRIASGVKDPLMAKAMAVQDGPGNQFMLISVDAVTIDAEITRRVRARVAEFVDISPEAIMLAATHTHTGGPVDDFVPDTRVEEYVDFLCLRAADAGILAHKNRVPARIGVGKGREESIAFIRRYVMKDGSFATNPGYVSDKIERPAGKIDPDVGVVRVDDMDGNILGAITNYACHLDTVGGYDFCGDYPGELSRMLKKAYGGNIVSVFLTGACGNINHCDFMSRSRDYYEKANPPHYVRMGRALAGSVIRALALIETKEGGSVSVKSDTFIGQIRVPTTEEVATAEALLEKTPYVPDISYGEPYHGTPGLVERHYARSLLEVAAMREKQMQVPVQVARMGGALIVGMPCELFVEFGLDVKARSEAELTMVSTLTNAQIGYIATRDAFGQGGYETQISGVTKMAPGTGYDMADLAVRLARETHDKD